MSGTGKTARAARLADRQIERVLRELLPLVDRHPEDQWLAERAAALMAQRAARLLEMGQREPARTAYEELAAFGEQHGLLGRALAACRAAAALHSEVPADLGDRVRTLRWKLAIAAARGVGLALLVAGLLLLAAPPTSLWPLAPIGLAVLLVAVMEASPGHAAALAWLCGLVVNLGGLGWGVALLERFGHLGPLAGGATLLAVAAYQAVVFALWAGAASALHRWLGIGWVITAPLGVAIAEAAVPFIFPWYLAITAWPAWPLLQVAELGGPPAVSALLVLLGVILAETTRAALQRRRPPRRAVVGALVVAVILGAGLGRAVHVAAARRGAPKLRVGIVQPNFGIVSIEARERQGGRYLATLREATREAGRRGAELVVWPESAFPYLFDRQLEREFAPGHPWELRPQFRGRLLLGALTHPFGTKAVFNSAVLITSTGRVAGTYDKQHLLAFGEYIPFANRYPAWAARVRARTPEWPDITQGAGTRLLIDGPLRITPLICYEDLLADYVGAAARRGPNLLVTLANHAWFGSSAAPQQALALATLRAIETRRDLVRATNTGVSSIGDALGRVTQVGPLYGVAPNRPRPATVIVGDVALLDGFALGPFSVPVFPWVCAAALLAVAVFARRRIGGGEASGAPTAGDGRSA